MPPMKFVAFLLLSLSLAACGDENADTGKPAASGPPVVQCVNYPLAYFAERLAGDPAAVRFDAPADGDPAFWKPSDEQVGSFQTASLILRNGADYAKWMKTVSLPAARMVNTSASFTDKLIRTTGGVSHVHGPGGAHEHGEVAFTTWLDFGQAAAQAEAVAEALTSRNLVTSEIVDPRMASLQQDLLSLDASLKILTATWGKRPLLGSHPVYQYLARRYGLDLESVHFEPDAVPSDKAFASLAALLKTHTAPWMLWEAEPLPETVKRLQAMGVACVVFDPCGNRPTEGDFLSVMQANIQRLQIALGG